MTWSCSQKDSLCRQGPRPYSRWLHSHVPATSIKPRDRTLILGKTVEESKRESPTIPALFPSLSLPRKVCNLILSRLTLQWMSIWGDRGREWRQGSSVSRQSAPDHTAPHQLAAHSALLCLFLQCSRLKVEHLSLHSFSLNFKLGGILLFTVLLTLTLTFQS